MKEHPILFSTPMVKAILDGRKTMTRRVVSKTDFLNEYHKAVIGYDVEVCVNEDDWDKTKVFKTAAVFDDGEWNVKCKWEVGDILWVRETWAPWDDNKHYAYKADGFIERYGAWERDTPKKFHDVERIEKWKPSIFMPKEACRLYLEITGIRVERLQKISEQDAIAEGIEKYIYSGRSSYYAYKDYLKRTPQCEADILDATGSFISLWQSINGEESWESNPWVWVIEFRKIKNPHQEDDYDLPMDWEPDYNIPDKAERQHQAAEYKKLK